MSLFSKHKGKARVTSVYRLQNRKCNILLHVIIIRLDFRSRRSDTIIRYDMYLAYFPSLLSSISKTVLMYKPKL